MSELLNTSGESAQDAAKRARKRVQFYAHTVCSHVIPCDEGTQDGDFIMCWRCGRVRIEKVREVRR